MKHLFRKKLLIDQRDKKSFNNLKEFGVNTSEPDLFSNENIEILMNYYH